jgi:hypothetical protein
MFINKEVMAVNIIKLLFLSPKPHSLLCMWWFPPRRWYMSNKIKGAS